MMLSLMDWWLTGLFMLPIDQACFRRARLYGGCKVDAKEDFLELNTAKRGEFPHWFVRLRRR